MKWLIAMVLALLASTAALGQVKEGSLDPSIDTENADAGLKLRSIEQEVYSLQQWTYLVLFNQTYGERIAAQRLQIPTVDAGLLNAYVFAPKTLVRGKTYPGLVMIHGAYHGSLDPTQFPLIADAVAAGYIVTFPEYRGSKGYGQPVWDAIDFGGKETDDIVAAADWIAANMPVDRKRTGLLGRSKGGMITLNAIERFPERFAAAVDVVGIADLSAYMSYKPDFRQQAIARQPRFKDLPPSARPAAYADASPINHVDKIRTPLLIHATTGDRTAPIELHSGRLIEVLKQHGVPFEYKIYDNAPGGHIYSQVSSPEAKDSHERIFEFLGRYLRPQP